MNNNVERKQLEEWLRQHEFFRGLPSHYLPLLASCAKKKSFAIGEFIIQEQQPAHEFFLLARGSVRLQVHNIADVLAIETLQAPAIMGWSWLTPPQLWHYDALALDYVESVVIQTPTLLQAMDSDAVLGREIYQRFLPIIAERVHAMQVQMLDIYTHPVHHQPSTLGM